MRVRTVLSILLVSFFPLASAVAQRLKSYFGPTLGISTPDFGRTYYYSNSGALFIARLSPIPSPIIGANTGYTVGNHLALDAALQYSYTGQSFSADFVVPDDYRERLRTHKIGIPLTLGYAANIGRAHIRLGVGGSFQYMFAARAAIRQTIILSGTPVQQNFTFKPFEAGFSYVYPRLQAHPRVSLSAAVARRLLLSAAYSHGIKRTFSGPAGGLYSSAPRNSAIDLTATYLIKTSAAGQNKADAAGE